MKLLKPLQNVLAALLLLPSLSVAQSFQPFTNASPVTLGSPFLLTDGTILIQNFYTSGWVKLTPDPFGSYVNGTWSAVASLPAGYAPVYYASAVLADGRLVIIGGEYNGAGPKQGTTLGAVYDPKSDTWTPIAPPAGWPNIGDAPSVLLANGQLLLGEFNTQLALLDPATLTWTEVSAAGKATNNNEEGFTLLPDGSVLDVNISSTGLTQRYLPSTGQWISAGSTPQPLGAGGEMGPAVLRPDGTVFAMGATGANAVYTPPKTLTGTGTWAAGPNLANIGDAPACLLPDGNVLLADNTGVYEFDGANLSLVAQNAGTLALLVLPTGQVLFGVGPGKIYTPRGSPNAAWAPTITSFPSAVGPGATYAISGTQFNGLSQAVAYGDDYQAATNYPLVRLTNLATGHVFYARTHDHSTMAVATGTAIVSTNFDVPANMELGTSSLVVVANGIPSAPVSVTVGTLKSSATVFGSSLNPSSGGQAVTFTATVTGFGPPPTGTVTFLDGVIRLGTGTVNSSGIATFTTSSLRVGAHAITATYGGDSSFTSSTSAAVTQTVTGTPSTVVFTSSLNPSANGVSITFVATVTGSGGTPTGAVAFFEGASWLSSATLAGGTAPFVIYTLPPGSHPITVRYSGDTNFAPSISTVVTQVVNGSNMSATSLISSLNPSARGQPVTLSATVTSTVGGTPTGFVIFLDGAVSLGTGTLNGMGLATYTTSSFAGGSHSITAQYAGDPNFASSTSSKLTQVVNPGTSATALSSSLDPSVGGQAVAFTATVSGTGGGIPTGSVNFLDGPTSLGTGTLNGSGVATFSTSSLAGGPHSITAQYGGDVNFAVSTSSPLTQSIQDFSLPATSPAVSVSAPGQTGSATITVMPVLGFTGTVAFSCVVPANMSEASCSASTAQITGSTGAASVVTIVTTASHQIASVPNENRGLPFTMPGSLLAGCVLVGISARKRRRLGSWVFSLVMLGFLGAVGCGGGSGSSTHTDPGTPPGTYMVVLTGTSGTLSHSMNVSVTVQ